MPFLSPYLTPIVLLIGSNVFMTTAWYWHLRYKDVPIVYVIFISWSLRPVDHLCGVRRIFLFIFTRTDHP